MNAEYPSSTDASIASAARAPSFFDLALRRGIVLVCGGATTFVVLLAVALISLFTGGETYLLGYFLYSIVPFSAIVFGCLAGAGYAIGGRLAKVQVGFGTMCVIFALQIGAFFSANYVEYQFYAPIYVDTGKPVPYWEAFNTAAEEVGDNGFGHFVQWMMVLGFALSGAFTAGVATVGPVCKGCGLTLVDRHLADIPTTLTFRKYFAEDASDEDADEDQADDDVSEEEEELTVPEQFLEHMEDGELEEACAIMAGYPEESSKNADIILRCMLRYCPRCYEGELHIDEGQCSPAGIFLLTHIRTYPLHGDHVQWVLHWMADAPQSSQRAN